MMARIVFLGRLRDAAGCGKLDLALTDRTTVAGLIDLLEARDPGLGAVLTDPSVRVAINRTLRPAEATDTVADADEVAFLPPVTGG